MSKDEAREVAPQEFEVSRRRFLRNMGIAAASVPMLGGIADALMDMPANASVKERVAAGRRAQATQGSDPFAAHPNYKFAFVNHVTTNPFFVPTQYGARDACTLLGTSYTWSGSANSIVSQMVTAMDTAISAKVSGIAVPVIDASAFISPTNRGLAAGIPVIAYNASAPSSTAAQNKQLAYIGQDLLQAGVDAGQKILPYVKKGDLVAGLIATPGSLNIQPRIDGAKSVLAPKGIDFIEQGTGALTSQESTAVEAYYLGHQDVKFMYAVDDGTGEAVAQTIVKHKLQGKVYGSGWDVAVPELQAVKSGALAFSIDQQAYLQGFLPVVQLFLYQISGGLMRPSDTDTGLLFVTKANVGPYLASSTRYEGSSTSPKTLTPPKVITL